MLRMVLLIVKLALFSISVLLLGSLVHWNGKTVSDQIKTTIAHTERSEWANLPNLQRWPGWVIGRVGNWAGSFVSDSQKGVKRLSIAKPTSSLPRNQSQKTLEAQVTGDGNSLDATKPSERQKLRALIKELNSSRKQN